MEREHEAVWGACVPGGPGGGEVGGEAELTPQHYRAQMEPPRDEVEIGKLVSAEKVRADVFGLARRTRDRVLGLPDRLAPRITGLTDASEIERLLTDEIRIACRELDEVCGARPAG